MAERALILEVRVYRLHVKACRVCCFTNPPPANSARYRVENLLRFLKSGNASIVSQIIRIAT